MEALFMEKHNINESITDVLLFGMRVWGNDETNVPLFVRWGVFYKNINEKNS